MNKKLITFIIIGSLVFLFPMTQAYDDILTPIQTMEGDKPDKKQFSADVDQAIYNQRFKSIVECELEEAELVTEPITDLSGENDNNLPKTSSTPIPAVNKLFKKVFSYVPEEKETGGTSAPRLLPGEDVIIEQEETELNTVPIYQDEKEQVRSNRPITLTVGLDRRRVHLDESFTLHVDIIVKNEKDLGKVKLPKLLHFEMINRSQSNNSEVVRGELWHRCTINYVFLGQQPGVFKINPISVKYKGKEYRSRALKIRVEGTNSGVAYRRRFSGVGYNQQTILPGAPKTKIADNDGVEFIADIDKKSAYVNEQITLTIRLQYTSDEKTMMTHIPPMITGFITEALPQINKEEQISSTRQRLLDRCYRTALFPVRAGNFSIGMGQVLITTRNKQKEYFSDSLTVNVRPLPKDPRSIHKNKHNALVGRFQLASEWETMESEVQRAIKLIITLSGTGNLRSAPEPVINVISGCRLYLEKTRELIEPIRGKIQGRKTYQYLAVFEKPGQFQFEPALIRYFDSHAKNWQTASAVIPKVSMSAQKQLTKHVIKRRELRPRTLQLRHNHGHRGSLSGNQRLLIFKWWFWVIQLFGPLAIIAVAFGKGYSEKKFADQKTWRMRRAYKQAKKSMRHLKHLIYDGEVRKFYDGLTKTTAEYLAAKFNVPTTYISAERIADYFFRNKLPEGLVGCFKIALTACEYVRFAAITLPVKDMHALHKDLKTAVKEFEQVWKAREKIKKSKINANIMVIIISIFLSSISWGQAPELVFTQGNAFAENGEIKKAEASFKTLLSKGITTPAIYYNLGNLYLQQGRLGEAILAYERAKWMLPGDSDCNYNLKKARELVLIKDLDTSQPGFILMMRKAFQMFTADELLLGAVIIYWAMIAMSILWIIKPKRFPGLKKWTWLAMLPLLIMIVWSAARYSERYWWQEAVVLTDQARLYVRPYPQADTLLDLPEGLGVTILGQEEAWVKISLGPNHHGWVKRYTLGFIK